MPPLGVRLCDRCWKRVADEFAEAEGATDSPRADGVRGEPGLGPPGRERCHRCRAEVEKYRTNYERWVSLGTRDLLSETAGVQYSWRLLPVKAAHSPWDVDHVAQKIHPSTWRPRELVRLAHRAECSDRAA